jgi:hypothetical protein
MTIISTSPGGASAFSSASGGKVYSFNNMSTTPQQVVAANPSRQRIIFHNPGASVDIFVAPAKVVAGGTQAALAPTTSALGGCFRVFAGATLEISGECQGAWQAFSASSTGLPLTVMDSNL